MDTIRRLFFIIKRLIEKPHTINQLKRKLCDEFQLEKEPSHHAINKDFERIKKAGFVITALPKRDKNGISYKIEKTPFHYLPNQEEEDLIKDIFSTYSNNPYVLNSFFDNISFLLNFDLQDILSNSEINCNNNEKYLEILNIIKKAINYNRSNINKISFKYKSTGGNEKIHSGFPYKIEASRK